MATKCRVWLPGGSYHITIRGNRKEAIFLEEYDYYVYLSTLKNNLQFYKEDGYKIISYCLMTNHVHLLLKTDKKDPSFFMRRLNSMYARYFNDKYVYEGHLLQERYYSNTITSVIELLEVSRYIHLNPVRAKITKKPEEYRFSSYNRMINKNTEYESKSEISISAEEILDLLDIYLIVKDNNIENIRNGVRDNIKSAKDKYRQYVEEKIEE